MRGFYRFVGLSILLSLCACLPQATQTGVPSGIEGMMAAGGANAGTEKETSSKGGGDEYFVEDLPSAGAAATGMPPPSSTSKAAYADNAPGGMMPSGIMAPGPIPGEDPGVFAFLMFGDLNAECNVGAIGKTELSVSGKVVTKYEDGSIRSCKSCYYSELRAVYEQGGVKRWRAIEFGDQGEFTIDRWLVDWDTVRFYHAPYTVTIFGKPKGGACPADSCLAAATPIELHLIQNPRIEDAPECPPASHKELTSMAIVRPRLPQLSFVGQVKNLCRWHDWATKVHVEGKLVWTDPDTGTESSHCPSEAAGCVSNETIQQTWRPFLASDLDTKFPEFKTKPEDIDSYLWAGADIMTLNDTPIHRLFIYDLAKKINIAELPLQLETEPAPANLRACFDSLGIIRVLK